MRKKCIVMSLIVVLTMFLLQGCSMEGETSIRVVPNERGTRIEATLKADESKNYEWVYYTKNNKLTESATEFSNDIFSSTYTQKYGFVIDEKDSDTIYFVLYQTDDIENGRIFEYDIAYDEDGNIVLGDQKETYLKNNPELLSKVQEAQ
ncbi:MAG: hypothetical protein E7289_03865 [Lachnospiraceae bacterium]|nr:hypothetical protein [Lachnospiraceae bacterium]